MRRPALQIVPHLQTFAAILRRAAGVLRSAVPTSAVLGLPVLLPVLGLAPGAAQALDFPSHPIRLIVGFTAGTSTDFTARILASGMSKALGQQVVVEDRPGAGSSIAAEQVVRAPNDGYTLLMGTVANVINGAIRRLPFDFTINLEPIILAGEAPNILVVTPSLGVDSVRALIALAKAKPDELTFGSSGVGTSPHVSGELFNIMAGVRTVHVPYQGSAPAMADLLGGRISMMFSPTSTAIPQIRAGTVKALASTSLRRLPIIPTLPTMNEAGLPGFETAVWFGLNAPVRTPADVIKKLAHAANDALKAPAAASALQVQGIEPAGGTPDDYATYIANETMKWTALAKTAGLAK